MSEFPDCRLIRFHVNYAILSWGKGAAGCWMGTPESKRTHAVLLSPQRSSQRPGCSGAPRLPQARAANVCPEGAQEVKANGRDCGELGNQSMPHQNEPPPNSGDGCQEDSMPQQDERPSDFSREARNPGCYGKSSNL